MIPDINKSLEESYSAKARGKSGAGQSLESAQTALLLADAGLAIMPDNATLQKLRKESQKAVGSMEANMNANVFTSGFHKQNVEKVVFSKSPIVIKQENPSAMAKSFTASDNVYGMAYLKGTIKELGDITTMGPKMMMTLMIDDNELGTYEFGLGKDLMGQTYIPIEIMPNPATSEQPAGAALYTKWLGQASPRPHVVKFRVSVLPMSSRIDLAEGTFDLDLSDGQEKLLDMSKKLYDQQLCTVFLPKPAKNDAGLASSMVSATNGMLSEAGWKGTPLHAVITESDWTIYRNELTSVITKRAIDGAVSVRMADGVCKYYQMRFARDYVGGSFGRLRWDSHDDGTDMSCENAGK